jgi:hypothetical protein
LLVFANDEVEKKANCVARPTEWGRPAIVAKRDIAVDEEILYCYGHYDYEWRKVRYYAVFSNAIGYIRYSFKEKIF